MKVDFNAAECKSHSSKKLFGLCDDPPPAKNPAYIDEEDGTKWIAIINNEYKFEVTFTAVDNCIEIKEANGKMHKRCDGFLTFNTSVIFVELKTRSAIGNEWVIDGEKQLKISLAHFKDSVDTEKYITKKAYIANSGHPKFKESQANRMERFLKDTGYILRIENRIILE